MLAVVDPVALALDRERRATQALPSLVERDLRPAVGALDRGGEACEPATDDRDPRSAHAALARHASHSHDPVSGTSGKSERR